MESCLFLVVLIGFLEVFSSGLFISLIDSYDIFHSFFLYGLISSSWNLISFAQLVKAPVSLLDLDSKAVLDLFYSPYPF